MGASTGSSGGNLRGRIIWFIALAWTGDRYLYFAEVGTGGTTDVHVAVHQGSVLPPG